MSRRKGVTYFIMLCAIVKHLLSNEYGPFDRFLEIGVFLFVGYEVVVTIRNSRTVHRRKILVDQRSEAIRGLLSDGQSLQMKAPRSGATLVEIGAWINSVSEWDKTVNGLLESYSPQAVVCFHQIVREPVVASGLAGGDTSNQYVLLLTHLDNLRSIMEKPEVYF